MKITKNHLKKLIKECIRETIQKKKLLKEHVYEDHEKELNVQFEGRSYYVKGSLIVNVSLAPGGFAHDWQGGGVEKSTEHNIEDTTFNIEEVYMIDGSGNVGPQITDRPLISKLQYFINEKIDFSSDEELAIQQAFDSQ